MAEEEEEEQQESEEDRLDTLEGKANSTRLLLLVLGVSSIVFIASLVTGFITVGFKVSSTAQAPLQEMKNISNKITAEFTDLDMAVELHNHTMEEFGKRLSALSPNVDKANFQKLEDVMVSQERDYQYFLATVKTAIRGLSEMVSGSRVWRDDFEEKLNAAITHSQAREGKITGVEPEALMDMTAENEQNDAAEKMDEASEQSTDDITELDGEN